MKKQSYSFVNLASINIGTMVGVGIFFKNPGILKTTNNIYLAITAWVVGGILIYGMGLSFAEAQSYTGKQGISGTLANWVSTFIGPKWGRVADQVMSWLYYPVFSSLLVYYAVYFLLLAFEWKTGLGQAMETQWLTVYGLTILGFLALTAGNALSYSFGKVLQLLGTVIKFIPLLSVCVLGFIAPVASSSANTFAGIVSGKAHTWNVASVFAALPAVFFAFDGFFGGLALSKEESKKGDAARASLFSIVAVGAFYVLFAAAVGFGTDDGSLFGVFNKTFGKGGAKAIWILISISAYTVANGMFLAGQRQLKSMSDKKAFIPSKLLSKVESDGRHAGQAWVIFALGTAYMTLAFMISEAMSVGATAEQAKMFTKELTFDNFGNALTMFGFGLYALVGIGIFANRFSNKYKTVKQKFLGLQIATAFLVLWVVIKSTMGYFFAVNKTTMWLVVLSALIAYFTSFITSLYQKDFK